MISGFLRPGPGRRNAVIAAVVVVMLVAAGSAGALYVNSRLHPTVTPAGSKASSAPSAAPVGSHTSGDAQQSAVFVVLKTTPFASAVDVPLSSSIAFGFNLDTDPAAVKSFLTVLVGEVGYSVIPGTLAQGSSSRQVVFKPSEEFDFGSKVSVTLRHGLQSRDGTTLGNDYSFSFTTRLQAGTVNFGARLVNSASGRPASLPLMVAEGASRPDLDIKVYKATTQQLLAGLVYSSKQGEFLNQPVDVRAMQLMDAAGTSYTASGARLNTPETADTVTLAEPDGIYAVVATDAGRQVGVVWLAFAKYGLLIRQDDQKIVVAGQDLTSAAAKPQFAITFYSLRDGIKAKSSGSFSGAAEFAAAYPTGIDLAIATSGGEDIVVPMAVPSTGAFIGVGANLSATPQIFLTTDRRAYMKGETMKFAGVARMSNDQSYTLGGFGKIEIWSYVSSKSLALVTPATDGTFSGSFVVPAGAFMPDGTDSVFNVLASAAGANHADPNVPRGSTDVVALGPHSPLSTLTVSLNKQSYLTSDNIVATITGRNSKNLPLAVQTVNVTVYVNQLTPQPAEYDSFAEPTTYGDPVVDNAKLKLDNSGRGTYTVKANIAGKKTDQELTVAVTFGSGKARSIAAQTTRVYQAADDVFLLNPRYSYQLGDPIVANFVVETRAGAAVPNLPMAYELDRTDYDGTKTITTVVGSGNVTTDANGLGTIHHDYKGEAASLVLRVIGKDEAGHSFEDQTDFYIDDRRTASLLDLATDKIAYNVGDKVGLTVTAPAARNALMSLERGRVHQYKSVQLAKGDNTLTIDVTPDLAPGFFVVFSYLDSGAYFTDELEVHVRNGSRILQVALAADQPAYAAGQTAHVTVTVTDAAGAPVAATLLVDGYDARMSAYKVVDQHSIAAAFFTPTRLSTNSSSSLTGIGQEAGGGCGAGFPLVLNSPFSGRTAVWIPAVTTDSTGHATFDVPITGAKVRVAVLAGTAASSFGQSEIDLAIA